MPEHYYRTKKRRRTRRSGAPTATDKYYSRMFRTIFIALILLALVASLAIYVANKLGLIA